MKAGIVYGSFQDSPYNDTRKISEVHEIRNSWKFGQNNQL